MLSSIISFITWQRLPGSHIQVRNYRQETLLLTAYAVGYVALGYAIGLLIQRVPLPILGATQFNQDVWYSLVFKITCLGLIPAWIFFGWWRYSWRDLVLGWTPSFKSFVATLCLVGLGFFLNASHLSHLFNTMQQFPDRHWRLLLGILMPLLTAAIPEELFFRGFLQTRFEKSMNRFSAIFLSAFLFTAWHLPSRYLLSNGVEGQAGNLPNVLLHTGLPVMVIGVFFGFHWSRYRNIILLVLVHWAIDILPSLSSYFQVSF